MKCGILNCAQSDNRFLWHCHGTCSRLFHAACVGVQRNHEEILRTFMLPLCRDCQETFITELNLKALEKSLSNITENIGKTLEANHKLLTNFKNLSATHDDALENIEGLLLDLQKKMSTVANSTKNSTAEIKNTVSSLLDTPPADSTKAIEAAVKSAAQAAIKAMTTTTTTTTAHSINQLPELITSLKNDLTDSHTLLACQVKSQMEEMAKVLSSSAFPTESSKLDTNLNLAEEMQNISEQPISGWRFLGTIKKWKADWTAYDEKLKRRALQQKVMDKAAKQRKARLRQRRNSNNNQSQQKNHCTIRTGNDDMNGKTNMDNVNNSKTDATTITSDKEMLTIAKNIFSGRTTSSNPAFINFQKGETINPYRIEKPTTEQESPPFLDPMRPPIVRMTQQSATGDRRFLNARLRDPKIMNIVRTYLSYLHDQPPSVCINGTTKISAITMLATEGLPTDPNFLREIFLEVHNELGISQNDAMADLKSHRAFLSSERTQRLQRTREAALKFCSPLNFHRN